MGEQRRIKRRTKREAKKLKTKSKIEDNLAYVLDLFLKDEHFFQHAKSICDELGLDYPKDADNGYKLPIFNKNPINAQIEIRNDFLNLFEAFQVADNLVESAVGLDNESDEYKFLEVLISAIYKDPKFGSYLKSLYSEERPDRNIFEFYNEEISEKLLKIFAVEEK
jgi:hypothetical protein